DDTEDELEDQELEAHYMYMAKVQEVSPDAADSGPIFDAEPLQKVEIDCAKARGDLISYKMKSQKSFNKYTQTINDLNQTISEIKEKLYAHQETISILSQQKEAQFKLYKTREDNELDKVITLENKVKVLDNIVYKTGQSVQTMNMLNNKCQTSFAKPEFLKKAQRANPRLYDTELSKSKMMSESFEALQKHAINLEIDLQQCQEKIKNDKSFKENQSKEFRKEHEHVNSRTKIPTAMPVSTREPKCIVKQSIDKPLKNSVASESNQKTRNITRKLYERVRKACSWWYPKFTPSGYKWKHKSGKENVNLNVSMPLGKILLFIVDSRCSKHMTGNLKLLINFVEKFLGTVKFGNDQIAPILGYGDLVQGAVTIKRVYYVEGLNHNLFSVGQFCDADLEVAFRKSTCYIRDLKGNDLLTGLNHNLLSVVQFCDADQDTNYSNLICLMAKATSSQAWLWHRRLSHLNFDTINLMSKNDIVVGLPKLKFVKDHLCSSYELGNAKRKSFHTKLTPSLKRRLQLLHVDLCGLMRIASINGKRYVLVIVDDYSRYTRTHFLRSKDETPKVLIDFLRLVQRGLQAQVRVVRTDKGTKILNQTLHAYFATEGIYHKTSVARTPEQNGVVERRNRTLVDAARIMLSAAKVPLFFWAEAIAPYHIINDRKPSVKFFYIFGSICYIVRDGENLDKMKEKGDECIFVGYSTQSRAYRVFNKITKVIMESIHVNFDELPHMASDQISSDPTPECQRMPLEHDTLSPVIQRQANVPQADRTVTMSNELNLLFIPMFDELLNEFSKVVSKSSAVCSADAPNQRQQLITPLINHTTPAPTCQVPTLEPTVSSSENINQAETYAENDQVADDEFINIFCTPIENQGETSSRHVDSTRRQLESNAEMCMFALTVSRTEPKNIKEAMADSAWIESMQEELHQFDRLDLWELVDRPLCTNVINLKWL
nr:hypothetical protein [Tanacetum cinerariifolium]